MTELVSPRNITSDCASREMRDSAEYFGTCAKAPSRGTSRCLPEVLETAQDGDYPGRAQLKGDN